MSSSTGPVGAEPGASAGDGAAGDGTTGAGAIIESLEALLATAQAQLGELRGTLTTSIAFANEQDRVQ